MARTPRVPKVPAHLRRIQRDLEDPGHTLRLDPNPPKAKLHMPADEADMSVAQVRGRYGIEDAPVRRGLSRNQKIAIGVGGGAVVGGGLVAARRSQRKDVTKAAYSQDGTKVVRLTARTPSGRYVSHENDLDVFHVTPKRNPTSRVLVARKGGDAASKPWVTKAMKMPAGGPAELRRKLTSNEPTGELKRRLAEAKSPAGGRGRGVGRKLCD